MKKKSLLVLAPVAVLALALCWHFMGHKPDRVQTSGKSSYQTAPLEQYTAYTELEQYDSGVTGVTIFVYNKEKTMHEFNHPILERQRDEIWYALRKGEEGNVTANLLYVDPGETKQFDLWTECYGKLSPGRYRAVFVAWGSKDYIAAEFDVI